jgi:uncharacterized protein YbaR (Trm112 family)
MKRSLMEILACPIDKSPDLTLYIFEEKDEIVEGIIVCKKCLRWYPIIDEIPHMLPDDLRKREEDIAFLKKYRDKVPSEVLRLGKPFNLAES